ncbi:MAG: GspH/FimT family pseudopilin [Proteobacteria bacterium]|nr:GspH/FimT family pseudopilin [Pseudomonadota bacterium]
MRPDNNNAGFTLVELMVTVAVTGILLAIAVPAFQSTLDKRRLVGAAEQLYADLQYARSEAIKRNTSVYVSFTTGADWCYGIDTATCNCATANDCQLDDIEKVVSASGFRGVSLAETFDGVDTDFDPRHGSADNGTATLSSNYGSIKIIVGNLGRVRICSDSSNLPQYNPASGTC